MSTPEFTLMIKGTASQLALILSLPELQGIEAAPAIAPVAPNPTVSALPAGPVAAPAIAPAIPTLAPAMPQPVPMPLNGGGDDEDGPVDTSAPDMDGSGLRWDERIHSSNHARNADGTWRKRRGVDAGLVAQVEAELRATPAAMAMPIPQPMAMPVAMPMQPTMPVPVAGPAPVPMPVVQHTPAPMPVAAPAPEPVAQPVAAPAADGALDFAGFMQHITGQMAKPDVNGAPLIHADYLGGIATEIATAFGQPVGSIVDIQNNPQMITYAVQAIQRDNRW